MRNFNEFVIENDIASILEDIERIDELLGGLTGGLQGAMSGVGSSLNNMWQGVKSGAQNLGQNISQGYRQGQNNSNIQKVAKNTEDLKAGLKGVGFTDPKVHGVLNNISNVLRTGLGNHMKVGNQNVHFQNMPAGKTSNGVYNGPGKNSMMPNFNSRIQQARNMYANQKMNQSGGTGI